MKWLAVLLAAAIAAAMLPAAVFAADRNEGRVVNGVDITTGPGYTAACGGGKAVYHPQEQTLTPDNAEITGGAAASATARLCRRITEGRQHRGACVRSCAGPEPASATAWPA